MEEGIKSLLNPAGAALNGLILSVARSLPSIFGAILLLLLGFALAKFAEWATRKLFRASSLQTILAASKLDEALDKSKIGSNPAGIAGRLVFWFVMLLFCLAAFDILGIRVMASVISGMVVFLPRVIVAGIIMLAGLVLAQAARSALLIALDRLALQGAAMISRLSHHFILVLAGMVALKQIDVDISLFSNVLLLAFVAFMLFAGIIIVRGSHASVENIIAGYHLRKLFLPGDYISLEKLEGPLIAIHGTHVIIESKGDRILIPNVRLLNQISAIKPPQKK